MNNHLTNGLNNNGSTPIKRLGLSRKRRSSCLQDNSLICSSKNGERYSETEVKKQIITSAEMSNKNLKVKENIENKSENKSEMEPGILDTQTKYAKEIKELENLYSVWSNGFKNAFSYLMSLFEKRSGESVNVKQLLIQLRIWEIVSDHFKNDSELGCLFNDGEGTD